MPRSPGIHSNTKFRNQCKMKLFTIARTPVSAVFRLHFMERDENSKFRKPLPA